MQSSSRSDATTQLSDDFPFNQLCQVLDAEREREREFVRGLDKMD